jgi:hypothetical protein
MGSATSGHVRGKPHDKELTFGYPAGSAYKVGDYHHSYRGGGCQSRASGSNVGAWYARSKTNKQTNTNEHTELINV